MDFGSNDFWMLVFFLMGFVLVIGFVVLIEGIIHLIKTRNKK